MTINQINQLTDLIDELGHYMKNDEFLQHDDRSLMILEQSRKNLRDRRYVVSIIAAMKAGKSTTFNALLGRDLLPNETDACTAAVTEIKHSAIASTDVTKVYKDGRSVKIAADASHSLEQNFHRDVRASRATNEVPLIEKYYVESPVLALEQAEYRDLVQNFILIDTPGPNEANVNGVDVSELQRVALEKLRDSDALIMLLDYTALKTNTNAEILRNIFEHREDLERDQSKVYFLVNKIDAMSEKDGTIENVIENVKALIRTYAPVIKEPQVYAFSAKKAQLARSVLNGTATDSALTQMENDYGSKYAEMVEVNGRRLFALPEPASLAAKILGESGILDVERNIIDRIFSMASVKLVDNAADRIQQVIGNTRSAVQSQIELSTQNGEELHTSVEESKQRIEQLRLEGERLKKIPNAEIDRLKDNINAILPTLRPQSQAIIDNYLTREFVQGTDQNMLIEQVQSMQNTVVQALQVMLNRETDKIQRLVIDTQGAINNRLNKAFMDLSEEANAIIGKKMNLQFQTFRMGDLDYTMKSDLDIDNSLIEKSGDDGVKEEGSLMKDILKGAGIGFGSGIILPGIGNIAGAIVGGVVGLFKNLWSNRNDHSAVLRIELAPVKKNLKDYVSGHVEKLVKELSADLSKSNASYMKFVDGQLNLFTANLKNQLDQIVRDYENNKGNLDRHLQHMSQIRQELDGLEAQLRQIVKEPVAVTG